MDHDELVRLYGPWAPRTPEDVARLLTGYPGRWWIAGGWTIEAFTGVHRPHGDIDPSIPRTDVLSLRQHLDGVLDVWAADQGSLRPLTGDDPSPSATCGNLWLRPSGSEPWEYDVLLMDVTDDTWTYKCDARITLPITEILWVRDGIEYLRPEVQLLHKAPGLRPQDQLDFDACAPLLPAPARRWLREALTMAHSDHPWIPTLSDGVTDPI